MKKPKLLFPQPLFIRFRIKFWTNIRSTLFEQRIYIFDTNRKHHPVEATRDVGKRLRIRFGHRRFPKGSLGPANCCPAAIINVRTVQISNNVFVRL